MSPKNPLVSVIIPTYNSSRTLKLALESVLMQDFQDFEVWVVGDGCTDDSDEIVLSFGDNRLNWTNLPNNSGTPSAPRNEGLRRAKGSYIAYLGHDDLWFPWHLSGLVKCIEQKEADFSYSLGIILRPEGVEGTFSFPDYVWESNRISPSNWLHRKELIDLTGPWPEDVKIAHDRIFLDGVLKARAKCIFREKLSVLKYPAIHWRLYSRTIDLPQEKDLKSIRSGAEEFHLSLLNDVGVSIARNEISLYKPKNWVPGFLLSIIRPIFRAYGFHRWPVHQIWYWYYRKRSGLIDERKRT
jgi:glycosyltransferase involved in cell wall biosynthesis